MPSLIIWVCRGYLEIFSFNGHQLWISFLTHFAWKWSVVLSNLISTIEVAKYAFFYEVPLWPFMALLFSNFFGIFLTTICTTAVSSDFALNILFCLGFISVLHLELHHFGSFPTILPSSIMCKFHSVRESHWLKRWKEWINIFSFIFEILWW